MNTTPYDALNEFFMDVRELEPSQEDVDALVRRVAPARRGWRRRALTGLGISVAVLSMSGAVAVGAGWRPGVVFNPDPKPLAPIRSVSAPNDLLRRLAVLRRPESSDDRSAAAVAAAKGIRSPFEVDAGYVRSIGSTPLGEDAYVVAARVNVAGATGADRPIAEGNPGNSVFVAATGRYGGIGQAGPFSADAIDHGTALITTGLPAAGSVAERLEQELPEALHSGSLLTGVVPDGVAQVRLRWSGSATQTIAVHDNVILTHLSGDADASFPKHVVWLDADGAEIRSFDFA